jgi:transcriptional regulator with XRE-family HTH domain
VTDPSTAIGETVQRIRASKNMNRDQLADLAGVTPRTIDNIEGGASNPSYRTLCGVAKALDMTASELLAASETTAA